MRWLGFVTLAAAACGNDRETLREDIDAGVIVAPDGQIITPGADARVAEPDAPPALTTCEEATAHDDLAWLQANVFTPSCATAGCHAGTNPDVGLSLEAGRTYGSLVNRPASTVASWTRVVPGSIATSYLVVALGRTDGPPPRDGFMPLGAEPLCVEKLEAIERWIAAGAPP